MKDKYAQYLRKSRLTARRGSIAEVLAKHRTILMELADKMGVGIAQADIYERSSPAVSLRRPDVLRLLEQVEAGACRRVLHGH